MDRELQIELNRRDRQRHLEELNELENSLAWVHNKNIWATLSLLIIDPLITAITVYYFWDKFKTIFFSADTITNWGEFFKNVKYSAIIIAIIFILSSLTLLWYLWRVASLKRQMARIKIKINRLEK